MMKTIFYSLLLLIGFTLPSHAEKQVAKNHMFKPEIVGQTRMTYMFWDLYDISLYAPQGQWQEEQPYALTLSYLRKIDGVDIAKQSVAEIRKQGFQDEELLTQWYQEMKTIFPDVDKGVSLTGIRDKEGYTVFYKNGKKLALIKDKTFTEKFFGIWLDKKTSAPELRKKLIGHDA